MILKLTFSALMALLSVNAMADQTFQIDNVHSMLNFKIGHKGISKTWGRFNEISGVVTTSDQNELKSLNVTVKPASVDTNVARRDNDIVSAAFLNAAQFAVANFTSTEVTKLDDSNYSVKGNFTLHGVTQPLVVTVKLLGSLVEQNAAFVGGETTFKIQRANFGMDQMLSVVSNDVEIFFNFEAGRRL